MSGSEEDIKIRDYVLEHKEEWMKMFPQIISVKVEPHEEDVANNLRERSKNKQLKLKLHARNCIIFHVQRSSFHSDSTKRILDYVDWQYEVAISVEPIVVER